MLSNGPVAHLVQLLQGYSVAAPAPWPASDATAMSVTHDQLDTVNKSQSQPSLAGDCTAPCKPGPRGEQPVLVISTRGAQMQEREKVALAALAVLLTLIALVELALTVPMFLRASRQASKSDTEPPPYPRFLVLGDWGRDGAFNQSRVAAAMAAKAEQLEAHFVVSTGDNFYEWGLVSPQDPQFKTSFSDIYHDPSLQVPWHAVLGNHDYGEVKLKKKKSVKGKKLKGGFPPESSCGGAARGECFFSPLHQLDLRLAERDWRWHCERSFKLHLAGGKVEIFFIDTTPFITKYLDDDWAQNRGGILEQSWQDNVNELDTRLRRSKAEWKLVVGHHPIRTNHMQTKGWLELEQHVEPVLLRHGVQAYFCGHDHNLQHIFSKQRPYHEIVSGAGSETYDIWFGDTDSPFQYGANGFVAVTMEPEQMLVEFLGLNSPYPLYNVTIPRHLAASASGR